MYLPWPAVQASPCRAHLDADGALAGTVSSPAFLHLLSRLSWESTEGAVHRLSSVRNWANTTLIFLSN